jgi:hypothetical protein
MKITDKQRAELNEFSKDELIDYIEQLISKVERLNRDVENTPMQEVVEKSHELMGHNNSDGVRSFDQWFVNNEDRLLETEKRLINKAKMDKIIVGHKHNKGYVFAPYIPVTKFCFTMPDVILIGYDKEGKAIFKKTK